MATDTTALGNQGISGLSLRFRVCGLGGLRGLEAELRV